LCGTVVSRRRSWVGLPRFRNVRIIRKISEQKRCPLCSAIAAVEMIEHLKKEHRRTEAEARTLIERELEGTLGWDPEVKKRKQT
jgi:hypothetical protein